MRANCQLRVDEDVRIRVMCETNAEQRDEAEAEHGLLMLDALIFKCFHGWLNALKICVSVGAFGGMLLAGTST